MRPLHLALVWHHHQPYYKDDLTRTYLLPWVRLRAAKDYLKMASVLEPYERVRVTFNLVPSLLAQVEDYAKGDYEDLFLRLARKPAAELTGEERAFVVRWLRESPGFLRVQASPRYSELAARAEDDPFSDQDIRDLQVWSNLAWCDPELAGRDPRLSALRARDRDFTEADKEALFDAQLELVARTIPAYADLARRGRAELTFSPFYHPILPLLAGVESARDAIPSIRLPQRAFAHRDDAALQVRLGLEAFERHFGHRPRGMWPSEMAVGEAVSSLAAEAGVDWMISDDEVLARSLDLALTREGDGALQHPELLYQPYEVERDGRRVALVFRDALLSNRVGFDYHRMATHDAVGDFMGRLRRIRDQQGDRDFLVTVALDGENAWDFYPREGNEFLDALYSELDRADDIVCTTVAGFLDAHPERRPLARLHTGSWIGANLDTWIGDPEHNRAWDLLAETRDWLEEAGGAADVAAAAWREIRITEGSDWFWWFSRKHDSGMDTIWDNQFRLHLRNVYKLLGARPPAELFRPILERSTAAERRLPAAPFTPEGRDDPAWDLAGHYEVGSGFGALHKPVGYVARVLVGSDSSSLHVRVDSPLEEGGLEAAGVRLWLYLSGSPGLPATGTGEPVPLRAAGLADLGFEAGTAVRLEPAEAVVLRLDEGRRTGREVARAAITSPLLASIPFATLGRWGGEPLHVAVVVERGGADVEQIPPTGALAVRVPHTAPPVEAVPGEPLKILIAAAEMAPFAKTGGLADVVAALAKDLRRQGHDARVVIPRYRQVNAEELGARAVATLQVPFGSSAVECTVLQGHASEVPVYLVDASQFFDRDSLYGYGDDDARFVLFDRALLEMLRPVGFIPDVIHLNDWHTALVPNLLDRLHASDPALASIATALTIHNLGFQGTFGYGTLHLAGLEAWGLMRVGVSHLDDVVNLLGRGIHYSDVVSTVSERYSQEIQTPEFGEGMDELLRLHAHKLFGIPNGIDSELFDPARDPALRGRYSADDLGGKEACRAALRAELGLAEGRQPVLAFISRFYEQKGVDLVEQLLGRLPDLGAQLVVLGTGDRRYEDMFRAAAASARGSVAAVIGFDPALAQRIYAGSDMLLMPSRFEPGGLAQLIALRYGTIPIVRATGGLAEAIPDYDATDDTGLGFVFSRYEAWDFNAAVVRAVEAHRHRADWTRLVVRAMREDVSWARSARRYVQLYRTAVAAHREAGLVGVAPA